MISFFSENSNINLILKTAGNTCNIRCQYCFELNKNVDGSFIDSKKLINIITKINKPFSLVFHGGEPLIIGKEKFIDLLDTVREFYPSKITSVKIQTNGILLDEEWVDLLFNNFKDLNIEIAISLDGTEDMHKLRIDKSGKNTFYSVIKAYEILNRQCIKAGMLSVISKNSLKHYRDYMELISKIENLSFVKINPLFNIVDNELTKDSITPLEYTDFIIKSFNYYIKMGLYKRIAIEPILSILQKINNVKSKYCNYSCRKCFNYISIYPNGQIGPCDSLSINDFSVGYIKEISQEKTLNKMIYGSLNNYNGLILQNLINICSECNIKNFCNGGCISQRYYFKNNKKLLDDFCKSKHILYEYFKKFNISQTIKIA